MPYAKPLVVLNQIKIFTEINVNNNSRRKNAFYFRCAVPFPNGAHSEAIGDKSRGKIITLKYRPPKPIEYTAVNAPAQQSRAWLLLSNHRQCKQQPAGSNLVIVLKSCYQNAQNTLIANLGACKNLGRGGRKLWVKMSSSDYATQPPI